MKKIKSLPKVLQNQILSYLSCIDLLGKDYLSAQYETFWESRPIVILKEISFFISSSLPVDPTLNIDHLLYFPLYYIEKQFQKELYQEKEFQKELYPDRIEKRTNEYYDEQIKCFGLNAMHAIHFNHYFDACYNHKFNIDFKKMKNYDEKTNRYDSDVEIRDDQVYDYSDEYSDHCEEVTQDYMDFITNILYESYCLKKEGMLQN